MSKHIIFQDWEVIDYAQALRKQEIIFEQMLQKKAKEATPNQTHYVLFCEHPHVFTIGKNGSEKHLLLSKENLAQKNIALYRTTRGGEITYHGFGQIVGYPILDLEDFGIGVRQYVWLLEEVIIQTLQKIGILANRLAGAPGVWIGQEKKIAALGIKASRSVVMHGFALNVNTDLQYFSYINPCGFTDKQTTSIAQETTKIWEMDTIKNLLKKQFIEVFCKLSNDAKEYLRTK
ncbi:MAG: lipoyl(octanoyl) transferase LipB [Microscillaceae bacterium]|nr:lipoyl(octanoyl) transferase LipB [Microscillaceae bacterium]MDW8459963.1 lipoyl(octanoyl) transferase LipB [Cytophagales bacterium]